MLMIRGISFTTGPGVRGPGTKSVFLFLTSIQNQSVRLQISPPFGIRLFG